MPYLTPQHARLRDDIRGLVKGEVRSDEITLQLYSTDASILECRPLCVVCPKDVDDIIACLGYAAEKGIPVHPRGAGTGVTGESLGRGIVLDFTRFMRRIISLEPETVTVQPGMAHERLNAILSQVQQRSFGPTLGFHPATTIGSILSRNGAGSRWLQYGFPSDHLLEMKVVLANGETLTLNRQTLPQAIETPPNETLGPVRFGGIDSVAKGIALARGIVLGKEHSIADEVYRVLSPELRTIDEESRNRVPVDRAGFHCHGILQGERSCHIDLARLITGSEGTLGIITEVRLKTSPRPRRAAGAVLYFNSFEKAMKAVTAILPFRPGLCELIDRRRLNMVREWDPRFQHLFPIEAEAVLFVELDAGILDGADESRDAQDQLSELLDIVQGKENLCFNSIRSESEEQFRHFDDFLRRAELILFRMRRSFQPVPLFEDLAVPVTALPSFLPTLLGVLRRNEVTASLSGHVGQGQLRIHPILNLSKPGLRNTFRRLAEDIYGLVLSSGGTVSSEYGTGLLKSWFVPEQMRRLMPIFRNIKEIFDPNDLLNPGKVIPNTSDWTRRLRKGLIHRGLEHPDRRRPESGLWEPMPIGFESVIVPLADSDDAEDSAVETSSRSDRRFSSQLELQLKWEPHTVFESTYLCNGCGECFRNDRSARMCPLFRGTNREEAAPRAKANLLRGVLEGDVDLETLTMQEAKDVADYCFHCQMCEGECPAEVDVSQLAFRCKSAYVAAHGLPLGELFLSRLDAALKWLAMISCPVNWSLGNQTMRWLMEKTIHLPQGYKLPRLAKVTFLSRVAWTGRYARPQQGTADKVALFVDTFANHFDSKLADLAIKLLEHNGVSVYVPPRQRASGLASFALGDMDRAERLARHNTLYLADLIRQGFHVVTLEPASAACMTKDYHYIVDDIDAALLTTHVVDFCDFLWQRHLAGKLRVDFRPISRTVGYHAPCRSISKTNRRFDLPTRAEELLRLIPKLDVRRIEQGCCGMAGLFGFNQKNYRRSIQIGMPLFKELRKPEIDLGVSDCSACLLQMQHGTKKPALHPIRILAAAYDLAPEILESRQ